jgi:hypothetical protein
MKPNPLSPIRFRLLPGHGVELPDILVSPYTDYAPARTATESECRLPESINFQPFKQHDSPPTRSRRNEQHSINL